MKTKAAWLAVIVVVCAACIWWSGHADPVLWWFKVRVEAFRGLTLAYPLLSWLAALAVGAVIINFPVPVAAILKVLSGYLFGLAWGFCLNLGASVLGGAVGFLCVRRFFARALYSRHGADIARANLEIARNGFWYILACRLIMATPFFLVNILAGLSSMRLGRFLTATLLGVIPSSLIYAFSGEQLDHIQTAQDLLSPRIGLILAGLGLAAVIPALVNRARRRKGRQA
jgi:uncharacterized membrane protein YdjX (TVP38/TMEM64 family)